MPASKTPATHKQPAKLWCRYCHLMTRPAPLHLGRPKVCEVCGRPYDAQAVPPPQSTSDAKCPSAKGIGTKSSLVAKNGPILPEPCFHLRDRNNNQTVHLEPQSYNACYARLRLRRRWLSPEIDVEPTRISKAHQTRYCFADYTRCPFFQPAGTPPAVLAEDGSRC
jgi:hypothetical protein